MLLKIFFKCSWGTRKGKTDNAAEQPSDLNICTEWKKQTNKQKNNLTYLKLGSLYGTWNTALLKALYLRDRTLDTIRGWHKSPDITDFAHSLNLPVRFLKSLFWGHTAHTSMVNCVQASQSPRLPTHPTMLDLQLTCLSISNCAGNSPYHIISAVSFYLCWSRTSFHIHLWRTTDSGELSTTTNLNT